MLGALMFIAFWIVLAFGLVFVAARGGIGGARAAFQTQSRGGRRVMNVAFVIIYVGFGVIMPVGFLTGNHAKASGQIGGLKLTGQEKLGRTLFGENCGVCHTLAGANAIGKVGPDLDNLKPPYSLVINTITNGCVQSPPSNSSESCLGYGTMPAQILQGKQAQDVAAFVARVAGKE